MYKLGIAMVRIKIEVDGILQDVDFTIEELVKYQNLKELKSTIKTETTKRSGEIKKLELPTAKDIEGFIRSKDAPELKFSMSELIGHFLGPQDSFDKDTYNNIYVKTLRTRTKIKKDLEKTGESYKWKSNQGTYWLVKETNNI